MAKTVEIQVPDIGDFKDVDVIDVLVKPGDVLKVEDPLITLETDKAAMDVPTTVAGTVKQVKIKLGDKVSEGTTIITMEVAEPVQQQDAGKAGKGSPDKPGDNKPPAGNKGKQPSGQAKKGDREVKVPDIGDFTDVDVIDVMVKSGDSVDKEDSLITLETDKAAMDVPSPWAGVVKAVKIKLGDKVSAGDLILVMEVDETAAEPGAAAIPRKPEPPVATSAPPVQDTTVAPVSQPESPPINERGFAKAYASPSVRKFARELGADLGRMHGSGPKGRITHDDVKQWVKSVLQGAAPAGVSALPRVPVVDYAKFGEVEIKPLSRIRKIAGPRLHASWVNIPHVTQHDEADITDLETVRKSLKAETEEKYGAKLTILAFIVKACVKALQQYPDFNSSLDEAGQNLVYKKYFHIGFAADTPNGLMVPVIRDADKKNLFEVARELGELAGKARDGKLQAGEMQGGTFSISSLGGIGGTAFTPIINAPEVAILGVSRSSIRAVWNGDEFEPKLILPLSLSYDHRVIDGAAAARFTGFLAGVLNQVQGLIL